MTQKNDQYYMQLALSEAKKAFDADEVPIGAVIVWDGTPLKDGTVPDDVVALAHNQRESASFEAEALSKTALGHAECMAIARACQRLGGWRLHKATLYVTVEPCPMCAGAIYNARIPRVVYGVRDEKAGAFGSVLDMRSVSLGHKVTVEEGVCKEECNALMRSFFQKLRTK